LSCEEQSEIMNDNKCEKDYSIIIPIYNGIRFLDQCLESALRQADIRKEIICIDDGSTDGSLEYVEKMAKSYSEIVVLRQEHQGAGAARNYGLRNATGKYVAFLDSDDFYLDSCALRKMMDLCEDAGLYICCGIMQVYEKGKFTVQDIFEGVINTSEVCRSIDFREFQNDFYYQAYIFNLDFLNKNLVTFPDYKRYQDPPFLLNALIAAGQICYYPVRFYGYRYGHQDSAGIESRFIIDLLQGIRKTLGLAIQGDYRVLVRRIVERLNTRYFETILYNLSFETLCILGDMGQMLYGYDDSLHMEAFHFLRESYGREKYIRKLEETIAEKNRIVSALHSMVNAIQSHGFESFLLQHGYKKVVIYGIGDYGKKLINMLKGTSVSVVALIDKNLKSYYGYKVLKPDEALPVCDCVIVSMMDYEDIVSYYENRTDIPVISFVELLRNFQ